MANIEIHGFGEFKQKLARWVGGDVARAMESTAFEWGERTMAISKGGGEGYVAPIVPVDEGTLMSTGHVQTPRREGNKVKVTIGYGGPAAPYASFVHEIDANYHRPNSGKDYLRLPAEFMGKGDKIASIAKKHLSSVLK